VRHPRATAIRHDPKKNVVTSADGREGRLKRYRWRRELGAVGRPAPGSRQPPGRQALVAPALARHANDVAQARDRRRVRGARAVPGRADQSLLASPSTSRKRRWQCDQVTAVVRVPRGRDRRGAGAASPTAHAAKRRCGARDDAVAKFFPLRGSRNSLLLSAHGHEAIMSARGDAKETAPS
jgi:hypothetical protein